MTPQKAFKQLLIKYPFYGLFLLNLNKIFSNSIDFVAGVRRNGINVQLVINPEKWDELNDDQQLCVLLHECMHICFGHIFDNFNSFNKFGHEIANISMDLEVNGFLDKNTVLSGNWFHPSLFNWNTQMGTKWYYEQLINNYNQKAKGNQDSNDSNTSTSIDLSDDDLIDSHDNWKDFQDISEAEKELIKNQVDYTLKQTAEQVTKSQGRIPGELQEKINQLFEKKPPIFNWKRYFRRLLGTQIDITLKKTYKKESIRFPDSSGIKHRKKTSILVAIDTSGSVSAKDLADFFAEIYHIWKAGANVKVIEADYNIQREYLYNGKCPELVHGRGGTSFDEPIQYYNDNYKDYTTLVYFTDGCASINKKPNNNNMIWILTSDGYKQKYPGKVIKIPK